jgi:hypothetical protein
MITAQVEAFGVCLPELEPLFTQHWAKLAEDRHSIPLAPHYELYEALEREGDLLLVTLRDAGRLVGYWIAVIAPGLHYRNCLTATMDIWNVLPEYENGVAAMILMRAVEREYQRRDVRRAYAGEKLHRPCGRLYRAFGYRPVETHYSKLMGGG